MVGDSKNVHALSLLAVNDVVRQALDSPAADHPPYHPPGFGVGPDRLDGLLYLASELRTELIVLCIIELGGTGELGLRCRVELGTLHRSRDWTLANTSSEGMLFTTPERSSW